ncbi:MAG: C40 family peptidase [Clostridia bacterium]|nr:C40 family peptidase [Clostridia bacterium]
MVVCVPSAVIYSAPELMAEQVDEMLYGEEAEILEETGGFCRVRSDYGYGGWTLKTNLFEKLHDPSFIVVSSFADLLFDGKNYYHAPITLPRGARVDVGFGHDERYGFIVLPSKRIYFIHKKHIAPLKPAKTPSEDELRDMIVATAREYIGVQYRWGGRTPAGVDCSGLCFNAYRFNGLDIWRDADPEMNKNMKKIPFSEAKKGDLLFFGGHMAIYAGEGRIVHATAAEGKAVEAGLDSTGLKERLITAGTLF